jgi:hypothetical protein
MQQALAVQGRGPVGFVATGGDRGNGDESYGGCSLVVMLPIMVPPSFGVTPDDARAELVPDRKRMACRYLGRIRLAFRSKTESSLAHDVRRNASL